ncbi:MAG TPA: hypothetical protein VF883_03630 [Thermoanaerobaculia bacterium]|jgi:hypothetical protein
MKNICTIILLACAVLTAQAVHAQSTCEASDPNRLAAVLSGNGPGHGSLHIDGDTLSYRVHAGSLTGITGAHIQRNGVNVVNLMANNQTFAGGVLKGSVSAAGSLLDELLANPGAFSLNVTSVSGSMQGRLNGRGGVLLVGPLDMDGGSSANKVRSDVASNATGIYTLSFVDDDPSSDGVRVDFDVMTDSIDGFDTATVVLVGEGISEDVLDLVSVQGFNGGRLHGSVRLSRAELARIVANPSGYHLQFRSPNDGMFSGAMAEAVTTFIPAFGRARNADGNQLSSDLRLYNPGSRATNAIVQFFPAGATEPLAGNTAVIRLEPGQSRLIDDAVPTLFGSSAGMGALRIVSGSTVVADSEIGNGHAGMGQFIPGLASCGAVTDGVLTSLAASRAANGFRTNVLLGNPGAHSAIAHFELRDEQGRLLDSRLMSIPAHAQMLMPLSGANGLFRNAGGEVRNAVLTMHADTPLFLGSSLVHNGSGVARFQSARDVLE